MSTVDRSPTDAGSLWRETAPGLDPHPPLDEALSVHALIIGAGFTGLRAALALAEAGRDVAVVDAEHVGWGASGRSGGQVNPALPFVGPDELRRRVGETHAERMVRAAVGSADELFDLVRTRQIECGARQNGWLRVDHCRKAAETSRAVSSGWAPYGAEFRIVGGEELARLSGSTAYRSGVLTHGGGAVQPLAFVRGLARVAESAGARIFGESPVTALRRRDGAWIATCRGREIRAEWVIVATNAYSDSLIPGLRRSVIPLVPIQIAADNLPDEVIGTILPEGHTISDTRRVIMYARREPGNRMVFGSLGRMGRGGAITGHDWLIRDAGRVYPQLRGVNWKFRWGGRIALTGDRLPHLHEPEPQLLVGLGYNGRGVAMSQLMGRVLAERALGAAAADLVFPVTGVAPIPFRGLQLLGKGVAIAWMRALDRIEMARG
ncbi:MAG: NAD(P)/FAD-dependent oxidoreductase [Pikeienuella sp.]